MASVYRKVGAALITLLVSFGISSLSHCGVVGVNLSPR